MTDRYQLLTQRLIDWHDRSARAFPWSHQTDPYRIWVSEIMLQQTRTETVVPYYERFLCAYPDVRTLARAELTDVLKKFEGLGYYARAVNLHKAARIIVSEMDGEFPRDMPSLRKLPGVGEYTAGAIASIAYGAPEPAIDGNQARVLSRLFMIRGLPRSPEGRAALCGAARGLLSKGSPGDVNQALMGMGAMVCVSKKPRCESCCVMDLCAARAQGIEEALPERGRKVEKSVQNVAVALIFSEDGAGRIFVRRRPEGGLLGGLWEFPCFVGADSTEAVSDCLRELDMEAHGFHKLASMRHVFTHLIWEMTGYVCRAKAEQTDQGMWIDQEALGGLPMSTALKGYRTFAEKAMGGDR